MYQAIIKKSTYYKNIYFIKRLLSTPFFICQSSRKRDTSVLEVVTLALVKVRFIKNIAAVFQFYCFVYSFAAVTPTVNLSVYSSLLALIYSSIFYLLRLLTFQRVGCVLIQYFAVCSSRKYFKHNIVSIVPFTFKLKLKYDFRAINSGICFSRLFLIWLDKRRRLLYCGLDC